MATTNSTLFVATSRVLRAKLDDARRQLTARDVIADAGRSAAAWVAYWAAHHEWSEHWENGAVDALKARAQAIGEAMEKELETCS